MARMEDAKVIVIWGANIAHTGGTFSNIPRYQFNQALVSAETKVVVIDPKNIELWPEKGMYASDADYWIRPRPNSDGILAMGFVKVLVEEGLFDEEYVRDWTIGFEEVKKEVSHFLLMRSSNSNWVPKQTVIEVARLYGPETRHNRQRQCTRGQHSGVSNPAGHLPDAGYYR